MGGETEMARNNRLFTQGANEPGTRTHPKRTRALTALPARAAQPGGLRFGRVGDGLMGDQPRSETAYHRTRMR